MATRGRSGCPVNLAVEIFGDRWTLLVLRDIVFADRRHFRELLRGSEEGITTSILADRLDRLVAGGILVRTDDPSHKQKAIYSLTERGVELVPVLATIGLWGAQHCEADAAKARAAHDLDYPIPAAWAGLMEALRARHLGTAADLS